MKKDYKDLQIGEPFEAKDIYEAKRTLLQEWTRTIIALAIVAAALTALAIAFVHEDQQGTALLKVWGFVSLPLGWVGGYYFRGQKFGGETID